MKNIVLSGFMGTGKSSVGRLLAHEFSMTFVDLDAVIENDTGLVVKDIFSTLGEPHFRALEREAVTALVSGRMGDGIVVATGGGVVVDESSRALLKNWAVIICLTASIETILKRTDKGEKRPLLDGEQREEFVRRLLKEREAAYSDCDFSIDTTDLGLADVVKKIKDFMGQGVKRDEP